jgi:uncharacterized protein YdbL (DUF1318 family)
MMQTVRNGLLGGICLGIILSSCSIKAPEVQVTGEKTALEREVVGTYEEMEEDTWMIASTRAAKAEDEVKISPEKRKVLEALQEQKFNKDDIDEFKREGYVGENNTGFLELRLIEQLRKNPERMKFIQTILEEENGDRNIIMGRVIELNETLKKSNKKDIQTIFAKMNQENSPEGTWIQNAEGNWIRK